MRFSTVLIALPALAAAQDQVPLVEKVSGWFNNIKSAVPAAPSVPSVPNPVTAGAAKVAEYKVHKFTHANYDEKLKPTSADPADGPENWLIYVTGGNKTCFGRCDTVDKAWNASIPILSVLPNAPNFGLIDCERQGILCTTWAAGVPSLYLFKVPISAPDQTPPTTPLYIKPLNLTTTTAADIVSFYAQEEYAAKTIDPKTGKEVDQYLYDSYFHPINGQLKVFGLLDPLGYLMWGMSQIPSFVFMILISFVSRNIMSRRTGAGARPAGAGGPGQGAPAAAPAK